MDILKQLKDKGHRITPQRKKVLEQLYAHPQTVEEVFEGLRKKDVSIDLTSVYRSLQLFTEYDIIHAIDFGDGKKRYELVKEDEHHHHVICNDCGKVADITLPDEKNLISLVSKQSDFHVTRHQLEFFGQCQSCR